MFNGYFYAHCMLSGPSDLQSEVKDETPFRYAHAEIRTQVVVICDVTRYQLDHGGAPLRGSVIFGLNSRKLGISE